MQNNNYSSNGSFVPVIIYNNAGTDRSNILSELRGKAGIYMWTHLETGKIYIGSAFDLSLRLKMYFSPSGLKFMNNYISRALVLHTHSAFSLSVLEYIDVTGLSLEESRLLILEREQFYLDLVFSEDEPNTYNILQTAGSFLGHKHSEESKAKKRGENNPMFGKTHSAETLVKMSGENHPRGMLGKTHSADTKAKYSESRGTAIYVYDSEGALVNTFSSARKAAEFFNCSHPTVMVYVKNNKLFQDKWILSTIDIPAYSIVSSRISSADSSPASTTSSPTSTAPASTVSSTGS